MADPRRLRLIYGDHTKPDKIDAESLARLARVDPRMLAPVEHGTAQQQAARTVLRARDALVRARTDLVNHVRGAVKSFGQRPLSCHARAFARKVAAHVLEILRPALASVLDNIAMLSREIHELETRIEDISAERYFVTAHLREIRGVGPGTSLALVLAVGDPWRFEKSRTVGSYFGLRPRQRQSGDRDPQIHETKAGDGYVRRVLLQCAHYILGPFGGDCNLRRWGLKLIERRGGTTSRKKAVVAVARKLAVLMHRLGITGETYDPLRGLQEQGAN